MKALIEIMFCGWCITSGVLALVIFSKFGVWMLTKVIPWLCK